MKGYVRRRGENSFLISIYLGKNADGKKEYHYETFHGNKKGAERRAAQLVTEVENRTFVKPAKMTLGEFLRRWLEDHVKNSVRPATYDMYERLVRIHITPAIGDIPLDRLSPIDLQQFYGRALEGPRGDGRPGSPSPSTVRHIHNIIRIALNRAVKWQLLARNAALAVDPPRPAAKTMRVWTPDEAARFLSALRDDRYYAAYLLALGAGLRRGEILGLRWRDVDLVNSAVIVNQSVVQGVKGALVQPPKTASSRRVVAISQETVAALEERKRVAEKERETYESLHGPGSYSAQGYVFAGYEGKPLDPRSFTHRFDRLVKKFGLPRIRFHDLRHTHATLMLQAGVHVKVMSERLGHGSITTTMNTYAHVLPTLQKDVAGAVDNLLGLTEWHGWTKDGQETIH